MLEKNFEIRKHTDAEILLKAFICYGYNMVNKINGAFSLAIWNEAKQELFLARDHLGVKPLYYTLIDNTLVFASDIKSLFQFPEVRAILDKESISELFGLGPSHTQGSRSF